MKRLVFLLRIRTWILFLIFFSICIFQWNFYYANFISPFVILLWILWIIAIGYNGQDKIGNIKIKGLSKKKFESNSYFFLMTFIGGAIVNAFSPNLLQDDNINQVFLLPFYLIILYGVCCFFYIVIMTGLVITTIACNCEAKFSSSIGNLLRLLFFPLGVVGIQPVLNKRFGTS